MASRASSLGYELDAILTALPACKRCRTNRRRCDTQLPSCEKCTRAKVECTYYDHVLQEELPRSYIASLVDHLTQEKDPSPTLAATEKQSTFDKLPDRVSDTKKHHFGFSEGSYRYLGDQSPLVELRLSDDSSQELDDKSSPEFPPCAAPTYSAMTPVLQQYLTRIFFDSIQPIYPILDSKAPWLSPETLTDSEPIPSQEFVLQMINAIACHCDRHHTSSLLPIATSAHTQALQYIGKATAEPSIFTLQVAILLVLYTLFDPASGNLSQRIGFATRLAIDLAAGDNEEQPSMLPRLHQIIYCLESHFCGTLVRPASLQEPSTPLIALSTTDPLELQCNLYRIQSQHRTGTLEDTLRNALRDLSPDQIANLHPNIASTVWETRLTLESSPATAIQLVIAYSNVRYIPTFLTTHWALKAGRIIVDAIAVGSKADTVELSLAYGKLVRLLTKWSERWSSASTFLESLQYTLDASSAKSAIVNQAW
ncbi:hypothetical protein PV10_07358 [Exophiala mesophila]|uniref:Zn(2)-C6 fungal-type domain-containing protein n=1 Tax=Exophiala mesophila TaxID=212818 RepID=A0A0D1ZTC3_EXOME|nr:uncharacterized protein PV10_07358 [Exophiala mesophila]KIV90008.1 hypothetical protein PV10_07358 [Exophiala mesophila]